MERSELSSDDDEEQPRTLAEQLATIVSGQRLRVLIVGGGIAGATLAAALQRHDITAAILERSVDPEADGYMLGLIPLGGNVLHALGLWDAYARESVPIHAYALHDGTGALIRHYPLASITDRFGDWRGVERGRLLDLLLDRVAPVVRGGTVASFMPVAHGLAVTFSDDSTERFDVVIGADGMGSHLRDLLLQVGDISVFDTGWGGYVAWAHADGLDLDVYREAWGPGFGMGMYPVPGRVGLFLGGPNHALSTRSLGEAAHDLRQHLIYGPFARALDQLERNQPAFYWRMADVRADHWVEGRVALLGDAGAGFLPTAGVGASAAMEAAYELAQRLASTKSAGVLDALLAFEARERPRVEQLQRSSRWIGRFMFVESKTLTWARDHAMQHVGLDTVLSDVEQIMSTARLSLRHHA